MTDNRKAILLALVSTALFAATATLAKLASHDYHFFQILFFRQIVIFLSAVPTIAKDFPKYLKTKSPLLHGARLAGAFIALSLSILALSGLPLTTATTLGFANIFFVALLGHYLLGETLGSYRLVAIATGFVGVAIAIRPDPSSLFNHYSLFAIIAAFGAAIAAITVRKLSQTEATATLLSYQAIFIGLLSGIPLFWLWKQPDLLDWALLLGMGVLSTAANWIGIKALRHGEAGLVKSVGYLSLVYAAIFGFLVFGEIPQQNTLMGAILIIISAFAIIQQGKMQTLIRHLFVRQN
ncbi:DMT family transporter [uncultured Cohaesibacter sp.]|uniref:DMT family transporter n=1 Tax=uncultured Cohaesibacter sp. TaxID=1002546 RepID=UPI0029317AAE|nr:DMT family transporter [uncultured Cohaesibacter sp.]